MAVRDGARFLPDQLDSIGGQDHRNWSLQIGDDGSKDGTFALVEAFAVRHRGRVSLRDGPRGGSTANFLSLLCDGEDDADVWAFSDQDDVWLSDKLARAIGALARARGRPALYGARTVVTDANLRPLGLSPRFAGPFNFANALIQNVAGGNTMVMNRAARDLLCAAGADVRPACHDWWAYQVITGAGGVMIWDERPALLYRQHGRNQVGANTGPAARLRRAAQALGGRLAVWNEANVSALWSVRHLLTAENRARLAAFAEARGLRGAAALRALAGSEAFRQTRAGSLSLAAAAALGRL
jgi:glycosyltransferase involved in cell wall biosynthesis